MEKALKHLLVELGLSEEETRAYGALLELGPSTVSRVASRAKIQRTNAYNVLDALVAKNLIAKSTSRGKQSYSISDPDHLIQALEEKKKSTDDLLEKAKAYQTELKAAYGRQYKKPLITYVEGLDGIKQLYTDSLNCQDKKEGIRSYTSIRDLAEGLGDYADRYYAERAGRGIPIRGIVPDTEPGKENKRVQDKFLRQVRLIPKEKFDFSPEIYLYDDKLSVMSLKDNFGFMLQSKEIVDALKIAWQLAWERAGEYDKELYTRG